MSYAFQRWSDKRYTSRPPSNCKAARWAWDHFAEDGPIKTLWLMDGYWCVERSDGTFEDIDATIARYHTA